MWEMFYRENRARREQKDQPMPKLPCHPKITEMKWKERKFFNFGMKPRGMESWNELNEIGMPKKQTWMVWMNETWMFKKIICHFYEEETRGKARKGKARKIYGKGKLCQKKKEVSPDWRDEMSPTRYKTAARHMPAQSRGPLLPPAPCSPSFPSSPFFGISNRNNPVSRGVESIQRMNVQSCPEWIIKP